MPIKIYLNRLTAFAALTIFILSSEGYGNDRISTYYIRYDAKSSNHKLVDDNLLMVPADNEFRVENFSLVSISGAIFAVDDAQARTHEERIRDDALKNILIKNGLKSIKTKDLDTVVSYEGAIKPPVNVIQKTYNEIDGSITYRAEVKFSPISFPDKWERHGMKYKIRTFFNNFLDLFK